MGKRDAYKAWQQTSEVRPVLKTLLELTTALVRDDYRYREHQYIPMPATFLRGEKWEDTPMPRRESRKEKEERYQREVLGNF